MTAADPQARRNIENTSTPQYIQGYTQDVGPNTAALFGLDITGPRANQNSHDVPAAMGGMLPTIAVNPVPINFNVDTSISIPAPPPTVPIPLHL
jgi:hypothetical protein